MRIKNQIKPCLKLIKKRLKKQNLKIKCEYGINRMFYCKRCGYTTNKKGNLKNHYLRKRPCKPILSNIRFDSLKEELNKKNIKTSSKCQPNVSQTSAKCQPNVSHK